VSTPKENANVPVIAPARLPYHPDIKEKFNLDRTDWRALVESIFPAAQTTEAVILALAYCQARRLDIFKRVVHIVPVWDSKRRVFVETVWPGIAELRTTACRTGEYAGRGETQFGPTVRETFSNTDRDGNTSQVTVEYPAWARVTIKRAVRGVVCEFVGPQVWWKETYATASRYTDAPNAMWAKRPRGQLEKCAEAGALRVAFPEELGSDYSADEVEGGFQWHGRPAIDVTPTTQQSIAADQFSADMAAKAKPISEPTPAEMEKMEFKPIANPPESAPQQSAEKPKRAARKKAEAAPASEPAAGPAPEQASPGLFTDPPPAKDDGPGPGAEYLDAISSQETVQDLLSLYSQAKLEAEAGKFSPKMLLHIYNGCMKRKEEIETSAAG
jgi:phage recombination protein Bet